MPFSRTRYLSASLMTLALAGITLDGCKPRAGSGDTNTQAAGGGTVANPCGSGVAPSQSSTIPVAAGTTEVTIDCAAWQAFIALNWKADPNKNGFPDPNAQWSSYGTPRDVSPTVWESYANASGVFGNGTLVGSWQAKRPAIKSLVKTSKFGDLDLTDIAQAGSGDHWLTNQRGDVTYYEIMMNQDEYEFITQKNFKLTTAAGQLACATQPGKPISDGPPPPPNAPKRGGLNMPAGNNTGFGWDDTDCAGNVVSYGQGIGSIEIKAAWTPLPADHSLDYRYKTAIAMVADPASGKQKQVTVGLVGLHVLRKVAGKLAWIWATFEQIDNSPDEAANGGFTPPALPANPNQKASPNFTFFNPKCDPKNDHYYQCKHNAPPVRCGPAGLACDPFNAPMQITRLRPVGSTANSVTAYAWSLMPPKSVFNYYRLIDVQWPQQNPSPAPGPGLKTPLSQQNPTPVGGSGGASQIVANTTLESFQQSSNSCMDCHVFASIASAKLTATAPGQLRKLVKPTAQNAPYASDYSFIYVAETKH